MRPLIVRFDAGRASELMYLLAHNRPLLPPREGWTADHYNLMGVLGAAATDPRSRTDNYDHVSQEIQEAYDRTALGEWSHGVQHAIWCVKMVNDKCYEQYFDTVHHLEVKLGDEDAHAQVRGLQGVKVMPPMYDPPQPDSEIA